ncbi:MAG: iron-containing redox enzyme family protein [Burkholderiales bacterium]
MQYLIAVRQRVLRELTGIETIQAVLAGKPDLAVYARYLTNVFHYACHSAEVIALAGARCTRSHPEASQYLLHHAREEMGHELWALDDLRALGMDEQAVRAGRPVPACAAMIGFEYYVAGRTNPVGLFGWLYVLEAIGDDLGKRVAAGLQNALGGSQRGIKFVAGHGVADHEHTADLTQVISQHIRAAQDVADVNHVADVSADLYVPMFQQIGAKDPA